ncbi:hypothetical protein C8P63_11482 [Melghirimyces profundicolus]|uniref:Uncharacterized protein n=1 Tax=Melghirimyces profundicolus TaxID=1242148 RepID=A0A2T6BS41_9BACL|nr:hypothetical protein [Melghirimyces profundicolus]PTX58900.1 hypothetical protein C8P63_11482 [Melghirimyces profundicolus]
MDVKIALFIHILSIASWVGGITVMAVWLRKSTKLHDQGLSMKESLVNVHNLNVRMMVPVAVLTLLTGLYMLVQWGPDKPLYLLIKERFGSLIVLLYAVGLPIYGGRLLKKVKAETDPAAMTGTLKRYIRLLNLTLLLLVFIIFAVTFKF